MSVTVRIPTQLRSFTDGRSEVELEDPGTIAGLVIALGENHPGIQERLLDDGGKLRRFVNVYLEEEDVRFLEELETPVPSGARVSIIPAVAGGA